MVVSLVGHDVALRNPISYGSRRHAIKQCDVSNWYEAIHFALLRDFAMRGPSATFFAFPFLSHVRACEREFRGLEIPSIDI